MAPPLALYVHWPFCLAKCPYCDFNSHVRDKIDQDRFAAALRRELATEAARLGPRKLTSVFFGGGTPSLMRPETVAALVDDARHLFEPAADIEITLEADPNQRRGWSARRFSCGRRQPYLGRDPEPGRGRTAKPGARAFGGRGCRRPDACPQTVSPRLVRSDLCSPRTDAERVAGGAARRLGPRCRSPVTVSAYDRTRYKI